MIKSKDLNKEVRALDDSLSKEGVADGTILRNILKGITLLIKVLRDVRINQTTIMKAQGIALVEPDADDGKTDASKK